MEKSPLKAVYVIIGILCFCIGVIGAVLPLIPTTPFMIFAAFCFGKSSQRLHEWCLSTRFYRNNVEKFISQRSLTLKAKILLLIVITLVMGMSFVIMVIFHVSLLVRIILGIIWLCHVLYFGFMVKTLSK